MVIESFAGNGVFLEALQHSNKIGIGIAPQHKDVMKADRLQYRIDQTAKYVLVVENPPYGQYHKLSSAFILPNVYRKHTRQRIIPRNWRIVSMTELGCDYFTLEGQGYHVPTSFFVLDRSPGEDLRVRLPAKMTGMQAFDFTTKKDFDVFVFGALPKRVITDPKPNNRGYFMKAKILVPTLMGREIHVPVAGATG